MISSNNTISREMLDILALGRGKMLDAVLCTDLAGERQNTSFQVVVLRFTDFDIELWCEEQPDRSGELSDLAKITVKRNDRKNVVSPLGKKDDNGYFTPLDFLPVSIGQKVLGITVCNEVVKAINKCGNIEFALENTRAVIISVGDRFIHLEKQCHWSEIWRVQITTSPDIETPSEWENDEDITYEVTSSALQI